MTISEALKNLDIPVCPPPYRGNKTPYVTYQLIGQTGTIWAEGAEAATGVSYSINIYDTTRARCVAAMLRVKAALAAGGWLSQADTEYPETEVDRWHIVLTALCPGAEYG